jgi:hypothetical protein
MLHQCMLLATASITIQLQVSRKLAYVIQCATVDASQPRLLRYQNSPSKHPDAYADFHHIVAHVKINGVPQPCTIPIQLPCYTVG